MDDVMENLKIYQVRAQWEVFRIPVGSRDSIVLYDNVEEWLEEYTRGPYKLFIISVGHTRKWFNGKREIYHYKPLIEVDICDKDDAALFKLTWG